MLGMFRTNVFPAPGNAGQRRDGKTLVLIADAVAKMRIQFGVHVYPLSDHLRL
jgi:hypothetical protein